MVPTVLPYATPMVIKNNISIGIIPLKNGEGIRPPVSTFLKRAPLGSTAIPKITRKIRAALPVFLRALFSIGERSWSSGTLTFPLYSPSLGDIILSVTQAPTMVKIIVEAAIKYPVD